MRLWSELLIPYLPRQQLLGQHRECCALRGNGWGKNHSVVNYIFKYPPYYLISYHYLIMHEMRRRGYNVNRDWLIPRYRGSNCDKWESNFYNEIETLLTENKFKPIFPEHNEERLLDELSNLRNKGIIIERDIIRNKYKPRN